MKKLLIIGCGGIGSYLCWHLHELNSHEQLNDIDITVADDDSVELKNVSYQNFSADDILESKSYVIAARYGFTPILNRVTTLEEMNNYDCVVLAVDNTIVRRTVFNNIPNNSFYWIDLRSEGNMVSSYTKNKDREKMLGTVKVEKEDKSCQLEFQLEKGIIQNGNKIIAAIGSQYILNWHRGEMNKKEFNTIF